MEVGLYMFADLRLPAVSIPSDETTFATIT
jgi:hypothetical protein